MRIGVTLKKLFQSHDVGPWMRAPVSLSSTRAGALARGRGL
jgi:hypothetical protein